MNNTEFLAQAISKIKVLEYDEASTIAICMANTQVIRAICEQSVILHSNNTQKRHKTRKKQSLIYE